MKIYNIEFDLEHCPFCNSALLQDNHQYYVRVYYCDHCPKRATYPKYQVYSVSFEPNAYMICYSTDDYLIRQVISLKHIQIFKYVDKTIQEYIILPLLNLNPKKLNEFCSKIDKYKLFI